MSRRRILICDDEQGRREQWKTDLEQLLDGECAVELLTDDFVTELETLKNRELAARERPEDRDADCRFDAAEILIVDYDLVHFEGTGWVTGENVAYLARCYSTCDVIVGVNLTGQPNPFDLTLVDHLDSFADVNIGSDQLTSPALWGHERTGLSPWSWPSLPALVDAHRERVDAIGDGSSRLLQALGLAGVGMSRHALALIEARPERDPPNGWDPANARNPTFAEFVLHSELGLRGADRPQHGTIARVAAARATKWLSTAVLPAQDVLIDAPHLAQRNPLLLRRDHSDEEAWQQTTIRGDLSGGLTDAIDTHRYAKRLLWTDRPLWHWAPLSGDTALPGVAEPWQRPVPRFVFCEDVSRFLPPEHARDFIIDDIPTSLPTRYVAKQGDPEVSSMVGDDLSTVQYGPKIRFAL
jgi:hypothetical protein